MPFIAPKPTSLAKIKVIGVGGGGQNAVGSMIRSSRVKEVEFISMNTDLQALNASLAEIRVQLGPERTHGLGSGSDPELGKEAAQESIEEIKSHLAGSDMVFIAAGMGGGTGTGAAPVIAQAARESGALTVGVVTKPFVFEGKRRASQAEQGIRELKGKVDALIVIPNEKILEVADSNMPLRDAFLVADQVVGRAVEGISDLITSTGLVNVDFADVKTIMKNAGSAIVIGRMVDKTDSRNIHKIGVAVNSLIHLPRMIVSSPISLYAVDLLDRLNGSLFTIPFNAAMYRTAHTEQHDSDFILYRTMLIHTASLLASIVSVGLIFVLPNWRLIFVFAAIFSMATYLINFQKNQ